MLCGLSAVSSLLGYSLDKKVMDEKATEYSKIVQALGGVEEDSKTYIERNYTVEVLILTLRDNGLTCTVLKNLACNVLNSLAFNDRVKDERFRGFLYASGNHYVAFPYFAGSLWNCDSLLPGPI